MERVIGVDIGYGRTKVYNADTQANFPSTISSQVGDATFESHLEPFVVNDIAYLVGDDAQIHARTVEDTRNEGFLCSGGWFSLLAHALKVAGFDPDRDGAKLALGLPPGMCSKERYRMVVQALKGTSVLDTASLAVYRFARTRIFIIPQGVGIFYYYHLTAREAGEQNVAIADVGHHTVDLVFVSRGRYVEHARHTMAAGVSAEYDHIMQLAQAMPGRGRITQADIVTSLRDGTLFDRDHENYVKGAEEHLTGYVRNIFSVIDSHVSSLPARPDIIIAAGGGARLFESIKARPGFRLSITGEAELANAIGYWHYATMVG